MGCLSHGSFDYGCACHKNPACLALEMNASRNNRNLNYSALLLTLLSVLFGLFMPFFYSENTAPMSARVNLLWDSLYGLGYSITEVFVGKRAFEQDWAGVGFALWPIILSALIFYSLRFFFLSKVRLNVKVAVVLLFILTFALNVSLEDKLLGRERWMPSYAYALGD